jgi:hypothetical protein
MNREIYGHTVTLPMFEHHLHPNKYSIPHSGFGSTLQQLSVDVPVKNQYLQFHLPVLFLSFVANDGNNKQMNKYT